jgi:hypothetical protein
VSDYDPVGDAPPARPPRSSGPRAGVNPGRGPRQRPPAPRGPTSRGPGGPGGPRGPRPDEEPTIDPQAAFKGLLIVFITIVVGAVVFVQGLLKPADSRANNTPVATVGPLVSPATTPATLPSATTAAATAVTKAAPRDLAIVVGNAVDPGKPIAGTVSAKLAAAGYTSVRRLDARRAADRSSVFYAAGEWREDALAVARVLGIPENDVTTVPNPPPVNAPESKVFVIVGREPRALLDAGATATTR